MSRYKIASIAVITVVCAGPLAARAADFSQWEVRGRVVRVDTAGGSDATIVPSDTIVVQSKTIPEVDISYFFTKNISAELILTYPQKMDVAINAGGIGHIGTVSVLPPDLTAQYHFLPDGAFDPYVGAGVNLTLLTKVDLQAPAVKPLQLDTNKFSIGPVVQFGSDYKITKNWVANVDVKWELMGFDLKSAGNKISVLHVDPWLFSLGVGYKF